MPRRTVIQYAKDLVAVFKIEILGLEIEGIEMHEICAQSLSFESASLLTCTSHESRIGTAPSF